jgi:pimeloyl-ACP methyl ester carboxylesterase
VLPDGRLLGYAEYGEPWGHPVVSFHGWPGSRVQSAWYASAASELGLRLIAPERPGIGLSSRSSTPTLHQHVADVAYLLDRLNIDRFGVLGVSGGGPYALTSAAWLGDRVSTVALVAALSAGSMGVTPLIQVTGWLGLRVPWLFAPGFDTAARVATWNGPLAVRLAFSTLPPSDRAVVDDPFVRDVAVRDVREAFRQGGRGMRGDAVSLLTAPDFSLGEIRNPVHLWHGDADTIVPIAIGRATAVALPNCSATFLPGEGHHLGIPHVREILEVFA